MEVHFLTPEGHEKLQEELEYLRKVRRPEIAEHIRIAREDGDLTENAGYEAAKEEQAYLEGRIMTVESILKNVQLIEPTGQSSIVQLGSRVTVREDGYEPESYQIVGPAEVNPAQGRISNKSPLGQALLGRRAGESVEINTPAGTTTFAVIEIN